MAAAKIIKILKFIKPAQ